MCNPYFRVCLYALILVSSVTATSARSADEPRLRTTITANDRGVYCIAVTPDGETLACAGDYNAIKLWSIKKGETTATLKGPDQRVGGHVAFSPDGAVLASDWADGSIILWDVKTGKEIKTMKTGHKGYIASLAYSPNGAMIASGGEDKNIKLWDVKTGKESAVFTGHSQAVRSLLFTPDSKTLISASPDHTVRVWEISSGKATTIMKSDGVGDFCWLAMSPDGKTLAASGGRDGTVKLWDLAAGKSLGTLETREEDTDNVTALAFSPDGKTLAAADNAIMFFDIATNRKTATLKGGHEPLTVLSLVFTKDGKTLASGGMDRTVKLWDIPVTEK